MTLTSPLRFEPFLRPMVWGGRGLARYLDRSLPTDGPYGEAWEVSDHGLHRSVVADGLIRGTTLRELMEHHRVALLGEAHQCHEVFPWLIKYLDCRDWLSVQVHPYGEIVKRLRPGEGSKTEAWYVLAAEPGSKVYAGLKPGVGPAELRAGVAGGKTAELLHSFEPKAGDCVFLRAGTVHAVGGGVLMAEIQETSDVTFRLFDWNRVDSAGKSRDLHIEESFASIHWDYGPVSPIRVDGSGQLVDCEFFKLDREAVSSPIPLGGDGMRTMIVSSGSGAWADGRAVAAGSVWVLPASMSAMTLNPCGKMILLSATLG